MAKANKDNDLFSTLFGEDYVEPQFASDAANTAIEKYVTPNAGKVDQAMWDAYDALTQANPAMVSKLSALGDNVTGKMQRLTDRISADTPEAQAGRWADTLLEKFNTALQRTIGADSATAKMARARLGYGGRPEGSFDKLLRTGEYTRAALPQIGALLSQAGSDATNFGNSDRANANAFLQYLSTMPGFYDALASAYMRPANAAARAGSGAAGTLADFINAARQNFLGFEQRRKHGIGDYMEAGSKVLSNTTGNLASAAGSVMGMMGGIGGIGGMFGGGGMGGLGGLFGGGGGGGGGTYVPSGFQYAGGGNPGWNTAMWGN